MVGDCSKSGPRERILREATRLFGQQGYAATSVREVVESAGVTKPTLYYYFGNKEGLFEACIQVHLEGIRALMDQLTTEVTSVRDRLREFFELYVRGGLENPDSVWLLIRVTSIAHPEDPRIQTAIAFMKELDRLADLIQIGIDTGEIRSDIDPLVASHMLRGAADHILLPAIVGAPVPDDFATPVIDLLFRGMENPC